jgi:hypothetical protein
MAPLAPGVARYDKDKHLTHAGILSLVWVSSMERYVKYHHLGIEMLAIRYANWRSKPRETAAAMLNYCHCKLTDMTAIYETLNKDSQAGTILSRETVKKHARDLHKTDLDALNQHLKNHRIINTADYELPNTLKV